MGTTGNLIFINYIQYNGLFLNSWLFSRRSQLKMRVLNTFIARF